MGQIHDPEPGLDVEHHALADRDGIVRGPEVGEEDDRRRLARGAPGEHEAREERKDFLSRSGTLHRGSRDKPTLSAEFIRWQAVAPGDKKRRGWSVATS